MKALTKKYLFPFLIVSTLFLMWGLANNMNDTLLAAFKRILSISDLQSSLVQFAFYGAYFCFAIPAALFIQRFSYKSGILLGLGFYALGTLLFYPAGLAANYLFFLFAIYIMAGGCAILETAANPYILSMGDEKTATVRLNIAQAFNPIGALGGILLSKFFILSSLHEADASERAGMSPDALKEIQFQEFGAVSSTYMIIGFCLIALFLLICFIRMPKESKAISEKDEKGGSVSRLIRNPAYVKGVVAQFFYVGAQTCVWSYTIRFVMAAKDCRESDASIYFLWSIILFSLFRIFYTWLMKYVKPVKLMLWNAVGAICATAFIIFGSGEIAVISLVMISAFMSLMFPTIYGVTLESVAPEDRKVGASGLIMAIIGGALITPLQGLLSDLNGIHFSFIVSLACFLVITIYALNTLYHTSPLKSTRFSTL